MQINSITAINNTPFIKRNIKSNNVCNQNFGGFQSVITKPIKTINSHKFAAILAGSLLFTSPAVVFSKTNNVTKNSIEKLFIINNKEANQENENEKKVLEEQKRKDAASIFGIFALGGLFVSALENIEKRKNKENE